MYLNTPWYALLCMDILTFAAFAFVLPQAAHWAALPHHASCICAKHMCSKAGQLVLACRAMICARHELAAPARRHVACGGRRGHPLQARLPGGAPLTLQRHCGLMRAAHSRSGTQPCRLQPSHQHAVRQQHGLKPLPLWPDHQARLQSAGSYSSRIACIILHKCSVLFHSHRLHL